MSDDVVKYFTCPWGELCATDRELDRTPYQSRGIPCYTPSELAILCQASIDGRRFSYEVKQHFRGNTMVVPIDGMPIPTMISTTMPAAVVVDDDEVVPF